MDYTRREFTKLALAGLPAAALVNQPLFGLAQAKPNSVFGGVQIGVITYSYRAMQDQSAEATLKYILEGGINGIELMDGPAEMFAGKPAAPPAPARGAGPGGPGLPGGRANAPQCVPGQGPVAGEGARAGGGGRGGRGNQGPLTPEQEAAAAAAAAYQATVREWRTSVSMDKFRALRKMYNDAGVTMYAYKPDGIQKTMATTDAEYDYLFNVAKTLGASHLTMELPAGDTAEAMLKRMADFATKHQMKVAYHTHAQGSMTVFDRALAVSPANMINVDFGHYVAAGNNGGTPLEFLAKHHDRIASFHLKDRTLPINCSQTVPFGTGDGMLKEILQTVKQNKWTFPATIELEYAVPAGSTASLEVKKCVEYARQCLV